MICYPHSKSFRSSFYTMQAVILAAGRGTRLKELTAHTPKSLVHICGKPILEYTLTSLPAIIDEAIIVVGHYGDQIKKKFGDRFNNLRLRYVEQKELNGTGGALWQARPILRDRFVVLNGDDIYGQQDIVKCMEHDQAVGINKRIPSSAQYLIIDFDKDARIISPRHPTDQEMNEGGFICTGCYILDQRIFEYEPVRLPNGELGLPQTIFTMLASTPVYAVPMPAWHQVNSPEDIPPAELHINNRGLTK